MKDQKRVPGPDPEDVKNLYGDHAVEYGAVRAVAAAESDNPDAMEWECTAQQLSGGTEGEETSGRSSISPVPDSRTRSK
jgi:hypothetical protein